MIDQFKRCLKPIVALVIYQIKPLKLEKFIERKDG